MQMAPQKKLEHVDRELLKQSVVEEAVPAQMLFLMAKSVGAEGYQLRRDIVPKLSRAAAVPFKFLALNEVSQTARRVEDICQKLLFNLSPSSQVHGVYAVAMFVLKLVEERYLGDADNMAVLVAMLLIDDLKQEGGVDSYTFKETILQREAGDLLSRAQKEHGIYTLRLGAKKL